MFGVHRLARAGALIGLLTGHGTYASTSSPHSSVRPRDDTNKVARIDEIVANMTVTDLVLQLHMTFANNIVGPNSDNELYDYEMRFSPGSPVGVIHDYYPMNKSYSNGLQQLNLERADKEVPFIRLGECLHGVGGYNQTMFPQNIGMSASFDTDIVHRVGHAIGKEARSIGVHACLSPVLDIGTDPRWGRMQEAWGEDYILTSHMGVAYASGLSKNGSWSDPDAVVPVMKHFAAHGSPQGGRNAGAWRGRGTRQILLEELMPFKAAVQLGGVRGVMMAYSSLDDVPSHASPILYEALKEWGFDGFVMADDTGMIDLMSSHHVADSPADAMQQWFNAGGMVQFYDWPLYQYLNATLDLVANGTVPEETLRSHVRHLLGVKWDLGLFEDSYIPDEIDPYAITEVHRPLALEAAHKSIVLLENKNETLPLRFSAESSEKVALIGPFIDTMNYGDYSGPWGQYPVHNASTLRQGVLGYLAENAPDVSVSSAWGANSWEYYPQNAIPPYALSVNGTPGGLWATYYANTNFTTPVNQKQETPSLDWGVYPPTNCPSNNFSVVWEGELTSPVSVRTDGWIGMAVAWNTTGRLYIDDELVAETPASKESSVSTNIRPFAYTQVNSTNAPPNAVEWTFEPGATYRIRVEYEAYNLYQKIENLSSINAQMIFFWNLVTDRNESIAQAVSVASESDIVIMALGANWNSDGESGDRGTLDLAPHQDELARQILALNKTTILVLQGGRPFAIPDIYNASSAVLNTYFPGQAGGQAISDVLFGVFNPGGRLPATISKHVGQLPVIYNYKRFDHVKPYLDIDALPAYPFGYGLSYSTFAVSDLTSTVKTFSIGETINFSVDVTNNGSIAGSYTAQVYLLGRVSSITRADKQLVAFQRVYLEAGETRQVNMDLDVDRYLTIINRKNEWELEKGPYTFALLENGGELADVSNNVTLSCV